VRDDDPVPVTVLVAELVMEDEAVPECGLEEVAVVELEPVAVDEDELEEVAEVELEPVGDCEEDPVAV